MDKKAMKQWVKVLRSGEYDQTTGKLYDNEGFCCLGVLTNEYCRVIGGDFTKQLGTDILNYKTYTTSNISKEVKLWSGLMDKATPISKFKKTNKINKILNSNTNLFNNREVLATLNDNGCTFPEIADFIETNYELL